MWACANFRTMRFCRWATRQWRSHQDTHKTFPSKSFSFTFTCKWFLCFYFWAVIWSYIVDLFAALHELASASSRTLLKLASSVRALLKPYGDTLNKLIIRKLRLSEQSGFDPWHFPLTVPLSIQVHKWVNLMVEVTLQWTNIPYRGKQNTPSRFMPLKLT